MTKYPSPADIAEMKSRGYDLSTIEEAERRSARWHIAEQLCNTIRDAFAGVTLGAGVGLQEGRALDDYADDSTRAACRATDEKTDWQRITVEALNKFNSSLSFFDAEGMRFHLPAYLIADLHGEYGYGLSFCLTHLSAHGVSQFALLSKEQRRVVQAFLLFIVDDADHSLHRQEILQALDRYWVEIS